jgi:integrase
MQGEPPSAQGPCCREVMIEGQEQVAPSSKSVARGKSATLDPARIRWSRLFDSVTRPRKFVTVWIGGRAISLEKSSLHKAAPTSVNVTVGRRSREYLTEREVERLIEAAKQNRSGHRDATAILAAYRHGLRASEVVVLRWDDIDLATGRMHVRRAKAGDASVHPISPKLLTWDEARRIAAKHGEAIWSC